MTTQRQLLDTLNSVVDQRLTVPTNPYGGQCVAFIDNILQYQGLYNLNFSYLNAIDGLDRASLLGLKVTYFNGSNNPPVGSVFVSDCSPYHPFGHIGFVVAEHEDGTITTIEQNIDGNADALYNGGWVRRVRRNLSSDGTFSYVDWNAPSQRMVGWFELPFTQSSSPAASNFHGGQNMTFTIYFAEDIDNRFKKGQVWLCETARGVYYHIRNEEELKYINEAHKGSTGRDLYQFTSSRKAPVHIRLIEGMRLKQI